MAEWSILDYRSKSAEEEFYIKFFNRYVIGQKRAKEKIAAKLAAYKHGLTDKNKPAGILFFPGPSGVGKTFMVRVLAKLLIGDINGLTRIDCGEFQHDHTDSSLIGSPPGYVGYQDVPILAQERIDRPYKENHPKKMSSDDEKKLKEMNYSLMELKLKVEDIEGEIARQADEEKKNELKKKLLEAKLRYQTKDREISNFVKQKKEEAENQVCPSIILLDEIEKAHHKITRIFLSIFDTGETRLHSGEKTDFCNTFFVLTSNIGSKRIANMLSGKGRIGFASGQEERSDDVELGNMMYETVMEEIVNSDHFPTELIGRIGKENIIIFHPLSPEDILSIISIQLHEIQKRITNIIPGTRLIFSEALRNFLFEETRDPLNRALGARPIENVLKAKLLEPLLNLIIKGQEGGISPGDLIKLDMEMEKDEGKLLIMKSENRNGVDLLE